MWSFGDWLDETKSLQQLFIGTDPATLAGSARLEYLRTQVLAAVKELTEVLDEFPWKPWRKSQLPERRDKAVEELVDVLAFTANMLVMLGVDGDELTEKYKAKVRENVDRHYGGY